MFAAIDGEFGLALITGAGGRHGTVSGCSHVTNKTADTGFFADRTGGSAVSAVRQAVLAPGGPQRQLHVAFGWTRWRFFIHWQHVRQHLDVTLAGD